MGTKYHEAIKDLEGMRNVIGDLVFAQRQSKAQQSTNEQTLVGGFADAAVDCKAGTSSVESDPWTARLVRTM